MRTYTVAFRVGDRLSFVDVASERLSDAIARAPIPDGAAIEVLASDKAEMLGWPAFFKRFPVVGERVETGLITDVA
jgi:hypothetical protein